MADAKTGTNVAEIKKLETELSQKRESAKASLLAQAGELISSLKELGFSYSLVEAQKVGRPKKGGSDGEAEKSN